MGASGSSQMSATSLVPSGSPLHSKGGDTVLSFAGVSPRYGAARLEGGARYLNSHAGKIPQPPRRTPSITIKEQRGQDGDQPGNGGAPVRPDQFLGLRQASNCP